MATLIGQPFDWASLAQYKIGGRFLDGYPPDRMTFYSPREDCHSVLKAVLGSAQRSIVGNVYGFDDPDLNDIIVQAVTAEHCFVQLSLDKTQAAGVHERALLSALLDLRGTPGFSLAIGTSSKHAISHLKVCIVDGTYLITGSTNWSRSGEQQQDNELSISR